MKSLKEYVKEFNINENLYDGCEELSKYIINIIEKTNNNILTITKNKLLFPNIFFEELIIRINPEINKKQKIKRKTSKKIRGINESILGASYEIENTDDKNLIANIIKWNNETKIFNYLILNIWIDNKNNLDYTALAHEFNHAYEDYKIRLDTDNEKTLNNFIYDYYDNAREMLNNPKSRIEQIVGYIEYFSSGIEIRSFSKQALLKFKEKIDKYKNFDDALEKQYEYNEIFRNFINYKEAFEFEILNDRINEICTAYKEVHKNDKDYKNESNNKIIKRLKDHIDKSYKLLVEEIKTYFNKYYG